MNKTGADQEANEHQLNTTSGGVGDNSCRSLEGHKQNTVNPWRTQAEELR